jgi:mono/diheme cytochrome c family protein
MRHILAVLMFAGLSGSALAASVEAPTHSPEGLELQIGREDFGIYCAACHGADAKGMGPVGDVLSVKPADLTGLARRAGGKFPTELVARTIDGRASVKAHGPREMPVWGDYFGAENPLASRSVREAVAQARIQSILTYLRSIQQ